MTKSLIEYQQDYKIAEKNQLLLISALPSTLIKQEDQFFVKIKKSKVGYLKKLEMLYSFMAELSKITSRFTPCKKNCSACCNYNVTVSEIEIQYIENKTTKKRNNHIGISKNFHGLPCPFLKNNTCMIYEARPYVCRRHHALTPNAYWCDPMLSNEQELPLVKFEGLDKAFDAIRKESNAESIYDIRQFFG